MLIHQLLATVQTFAQEKSIRNNTPLSQSEKQQLDFLESLSYLIELPNESDKKLPASGPNMYGCSFGDFSKIEYCAAMPTQFRAKQSYCPPQTYAGLGQNSCDLEQEGIYTFLDDRPVPMAFKVKNLPGLARVSFTLRFKVAIEKLPDVHNLPVVGLPWTVGRTALAVRMMQGKIFDESGKILGSFDLTYEISAIEKNKWSGVRLCDSPPDCSTKNHSGKIEVNFESGKTVKKDFSIRSKY